MAFVTDIKTFAALGSGVIGSGWVARALANGLDVVAWDPAPGAEAALRARIAKCWGALEANGLKAGASQERLRVVSSIEESAEWKPPLIDMGLVIGRQFKSGLS